jgi:Transposase DDE domain
MLRQGKKKIRNPPRQRRSQPNRPPTADQRKRRAGRAFESEQAPTLERVLSLLAAVAPELGRWLSLGLALLTVAMLQLWRGARSGNGGLTLCALSRTLPLDEKEKARSKRLYRLLRNASLDGTQMTPLLVRLALGANPRGWVPIVVDQTNVQGTQVLMAGIRVAHRVLPVAFACFDYPLIRKSQNVLENSLLLLIAASLPSGCKPIFVMDRGYARASLLKHLRQLNIPYLIRGRSNTIVRAGGKRISLGRLAHRLGHPRRYSHAAYQDSAREPVDIVVFHDRNFQEPCFLLVPADSAERLPTAEVVELYRERMYIELTFRDWKTHLGLRGLRLEVDPALRLGRLLLALSSASWLFCSERASSAKRFEPTARYSVPGPAMEPGGVSALSRSASSRFLWPASPNSFAANWTASWRPSAAAFPLSNSRLKPPGVFYRAWNWSCSLPDFTCNVPLIPRCQRELERQKRGEMRRMSTATTEIHARTNHYH